MYKHTFAPNARTHDKILTVISFCTFCFSHFHPSNSYAYSSCCTAPKYELPKFKLLKKMIQCVEPKLNKMNRRICAAYHECVCVCECLHKFGFVCIKSTVCCPWIFLFFWLEKEMANESLHESNWAIFIIKYTCVFFTSTLISTLSFKKSEKCWYINWSFDKLATSDIIPSFELKLEMHQRVRFKFQFIESEHNSSHWNLSEWHSNESKMCGLRTKNKMFCGLWMNTIELNHFSIKFVDKLRLLMI